jgi:hypothetical protein
MKKETYISRDFREAAMAQAVQMHDSCVSEMTPM